MLVSAEEQGDLLSAADLRDDARGEHALGAGLRASPPPTAPASGHCGFRRVGNLFGGIFGLLVSRLFGQCLSVHHRQDLDRRVVVVQHVALGRLADQFLKDRFGTLGLVRNDIPLSRGGQGCSATITLSLQRQLEFPSKKLRRVPPLCAVERSETSKRGGARRGPPSPARIGCHAASGGFACLAASSR